MNILNLFKKKKINPPPKRIVINDAADMHMIALNSALPEYHAVLEKLLEAANKGSLSCEFDFLSKGCE